MTATAESGQSAAAPDNGVEAPDGPSLADVRFSPNWGQQVLVRIRYMENLLRALECERSGDETCNKDFLVRAREHLREARVAATSNRPSWYPASYWWPKWLAPRGKKLSATWSSLHAAEVSALEFVSGDRLQGWVAATRGIAELHLRQNDPRLAALRQAIESKDENRMRQAAISALIGAYIAQDNWHSRVRGLRNLLNRTTIAAFSAAIAIGVWGWFRPKDLSLCFGPPWKAVCPHDPFTKSQGGDQVYTAPANIVGSAPASWDVTLVLALGLVGAALTAIAALHNIKPTSGPYRLQIASARLKLPTGALSAFLGVMLFRGEFIPGLTQLDTGAQILGWSAIFGASQYLVTRMVDKLANQTLEDSLMSEGHQPARSKSTSQA